MEFYFNAMIGFSFAGYWSASGDSNRGYSIENSRGSFYEVKDFFVNMASGEADNRSVWRDTKGTSKNSEIVKFTEEQLSTKPPSSRDPEKWQKKGGKIEICEEGIWTYIDWEVPPNRVSYPGSFPDFKSAGLVRQEVQIGKFDRYDIDFATADELAPNGPKLDENTWHEVLRACCTIRKFGRCLILCYL